MLKKKSRSSAGKNPPKQEQGESPLQETVEEIKQRFGEGAIMRLKEVRAVDVDSISTGSISLDLALGVNGVPQGRVVEIYGAESSGKTTLALHVVAEAQKAGGTAAFVDAEHALDPDYAKRIGVRTEELLISQPDSGEQALQIVETLVKSGAVDIIVIDSVAALTPRTEIDGEMGEFQIGLQARLMSQALRKLSALIAKTKTTVIFLNQTRMKIGCFQYGTRVVMEDGSTKKIGYLVNNKVKENVLTYNFKTQRIESKPILNWFNNGKADHFIQFVVEKCSGNGRSNFACTEEHQIFTSNGYKKAKNIKTGDKVLLAIQDWKPSPVQEEIIRGGLLGDGCLRPVGAAKFQYRETHAKEQDDYLRWKSGYFGQKTIGNHSRGGSFLETFLTTAFRREYMDVYEGGRKVSVASDINLTPLSLAIWYQDDGYLANQDKKAINLCTNSFKKDSVNALREVFKKQLKIETGIKEVRGGKELEITFGREETKKFFDSCAHLIYPTMRYKVPESHRHTDFVPPQKENESREYIIKEALVRAKYIKPTTRSMQKFDIETENHNYIVDGTIVHNSYGNPETTPGGLALKFYSSVRINLRRSAQIKSGDRIIGSRIIAKIVKNKVAAPFKTAEFDIYYNEGISQNADLIKTGLKYGIVKQSGSWYQFGEEKLGQGMEGAKQFLKENKKTTSQIKKEILIRIKEEAKA